MSAKPQRALKWSSIAVPVVLAALGALGVWANYDIETRVRADYAHKRIDHVEKNFDEDLVTIQQDLKEILDHVRPWSEFP